MNGKYDSKKINEAIKKIERSNIKHFIITKVLKPGNKPDTFLVKGAI